MRGVLLLVVVSNLFFYPVFGQKRVGGQEKNRFEEITDLTTGVKKKRIKMNLTGMDIPIQTHQFAQLWAQPIQSQPIADVNQLLSIASFIEIEGFRLSNIKAELSWHYLLYFFLIEACRDFIEAHGKKTLQLTPDLSMALRVVKTYGIVPVSFYSNLGKNKKSVDYEKLRSELANYLSTVKQSDSWLESTVLATVRSILNHHLGEPPNKFLFGRNAINPLEFLRSILGFQLERYALVSSDLSRPQWKKTPFNEVLDNLEYNLPLDFYIATLSNAIQTGYPALLQANVHDAGFDSEYRVAVVPSFGLSQGSLEQAKRQYYRDYWTTFPDQPLLLSGYKIHQSQTWFLVRFNGQVITQTKQVQEPGNYVMNQDFVKINSWNYLVAKDALRDLEEDVK